MDIFTVLLPYAQALPEKQTNKQINKQTNKQKPQNQIKLDLSVNVFASKK